MPASRPRASAAFWAFAAILFAAAVNMRAADHPSLVDPATTKCVTCHSDLLAKPVQHPAAVKSCLNCHVFSKKDDKTVAALKAPQSELCVTCHEAKKKAATGALAASHFPVSDACTNCHDPHSTAAPHLLKSAPPEICATCHEAAAINPQHKRTVSNADCRMCHDAHGSENKGMLRSALQHAPFKERSCSACHKAGTIARAKPKSDICFACHDAAKFNAKAVHTAVRQGKCVGCHEPHLSARAKLVRAQGAALCVTCHADIGKKITAASAHPPAADDCTTCHDPHKSDRPYQLSDSVPALCLTCHDGTDKKLVAKHLSADLQKTNCVACHDPHGSPQKPLLAAGSIHPPFAQRSCTSCHQGSATKLIANGSKELCLACHIAIGETAAKSKVEHMALQVVDCTECHSPHAAKQEHLVKAAGGGECTGCHTDKAAGKDEAAHGAISFLGCRGCHQPHGGDNERMLRASRSEICLGCHDAARRKSAENNSVVLLDHFRIGESAAERVKRIPALRVVNGNVVDHPVTGHRATGKPTPEELKHTTTTFDGELGCLVCHDPHKGPSSRHFAGGVRSAAELCLKCHKK